MPKHSSSAKAAVLLAALAAITQGNAARAEGQALRDPLLPRRDAATAEYNSPASLTFFTRGSKGSANVEQEVFVPLPGDTTGHLFAAVDKNGKPAFSQAGAATKLSSAITGGVTLIAPAVAKPSITPGLKLRLQQAGVTLKFAAPVDTAGVVGAHGVVIKGLNLGVLKAAVRAGFGRSNVRQRADTVNDADLSVSVEKGGLFADVGAKRPLTRTGQTSERARIGYGGKSWYAAGAAQRNPGGEHLFTVSFGAELGRRTPTQRGK